MIEHRSSTATLVSAAYILSREIVTEDGVVSAALFEIAARLNELTFCDEKICGNMIANSFYSRN